MCVCRIFFKESTGVQCAFATSHDTLSYSVSCTAFSRISWAKIHFIADICVNIPFQLGWCYPISPSSISISSQSHAKVNIDHQFIRIFFCVCLPCEFGSFPICFTFEANILIHESLASWNQTNTFFGIDINLNSLPSIRHTFPYEMIVFANMLAKGAWILTPVKNSGVYYHPHHLASIQFSCNLRK